MSDTAPICTAHMCPMEADGECPWCEGTGDAYPDSYQLWMVRCNACEGTGVKWRCRECDDEADALDDDGPPLFDGATG